MNVLKTNNRFASLLEVNIPTHTRHATDSRYINKYNYDTKYDTKHDTKNIKINNTNINMNDFPVLIDARINDNVCDGKPNYVAKVLHQNIIEPETDELLPYGWIVITPNKYKTNVVKINHMEPSWEKAMDSLVKLYNKRKDEYIAMWGEETYENMFLFPNYDYDYDYYDDDEDYDDDDDDNDDEDYDNDDEYYN